MGAGDDGEGEGGGMVRLMGWDGFWELDLEGFWKHGGCWGLFTGFGMVYSHLLEHLEERCILALRHIGYWPRIY